MPIRRAHLLGRCAFCLVLALAGSVVRADDDDDHDRARGAVERGEALPLPEVLARLKPKLDGDIVGVGFEREHGRWTYEFKIVTRNGTMRRVTVDAGSGKPIRGDD